MKLEVYRELSNIFTELEIKMDCEWEGDEDQLKNMFEELITDLFNRIDVRESVTQAISKIPDSWPQPIIKLFAILVDNMTPEGANLTVSTTPEGVAIRFNENQVLRLEKNMNNS